ncbi:MAG: SIS domain-containing protein [Candidatus Nanopelagicales bacterium]
MNPELFAKDLAQKPAALRSLANRLADEHPWPTLTQANHLVFLGMGSSHYANNIAASRLRALGINAVAELASSDLLPKATSETVVIAVSASGGSIETLAAQEHYQRKCRIIAVTNTADSKITEGAEAVVMMHAASEEGGVACRSFQHTLALLLDLQSQLVGGLDVPSLIRASAEATDDLLQSRDIWLPQVSELILGPQGTHVVAPARRFSSAQQSALMLREGPRLPSVACETGDWSHVDVYLTKSTDYRMLLLAGSKWEPELLRWVTERGSTLVAVGQDVPGSALNLRYRGDENDDVKLLTETLVAELVAQQAWAATN